MAKNDNKDYLEHWVKNFNKGHGYAGVFNYSNSADKRVVERAAIEEWCRSIKAEFGVETQAPHLNPDDPPDFFVSVRGQTCSVELVQLVEQKHKERAMQGETPFAGKLFLDMQWSQERLISKLHEAITKKGEKYKKSGLVIDVLVIHTAEPWLTSGQAQAWLESVSIQAHPSFRAVFLLFEYEPGRRVEHWPVVSIYGQLP